MVIIGACLMSFSVPLLILIVGYEESGSFRSIELFQFVSRIDNPEAVIAVLAIIAIIGFILILVGNHLEQQNRMINSINNANNPCHCNNCKTNLSSEVEICPICKNKLK